METSENGLRDFVSVLKRRKNILLLTFLGLLAVSTLVAFLWPPTYRSTATILIRDQEIPRDLVPSTITSFADQRLMEIQARVVTSANLSKLIEDFNLYPDDQKRLPTTEIVEEMRGDYSLDLVSADVIDPRTGRPTQATILFTVSFDYESAAVAQQVTNRLVNLYLNENLRDRTERAQETTSFLAEQADKLNREISQAEARLARFKEQNGGALPELLPLNMQMMERTESEMKEILRQIQALNESRIYLTAQLALASPSAPMRTSEGMILPPDEQLTALQSQYATLSATYGPNHPDVVKARRQIEGLEGSVDQIDLATIENQVQTVYAELREIKERYGASHPDVLRKERQYERLLVERDAAADAQEFNDQAAEAPQATSSPTNPTYIQLQSQIAAADADIRSFRGRYEQLQEKLEDYEQRIVTGPQVEREYSGIIRDLDNARVKYQEIRAKELSAEVAESLEQGRKGERFEVVEPALLPTLPHTPNRLALLFLGLVLSMAGSVGTTAASESMDTSVYGPRGLTAVIGVPPIATIPFIANELDTSRDRRTIWLIIGGILAAIIVVLLLVHFLYRPLDILWFTLLRKLGI